MDQFQKVVWSALLFFLILNVGAISGQEWSKEQKMVWKNVQDYWELSATGKIEEFLTYFDDNYLGWSKSDPLPSDKAESKKWMSYYWEKRKVMIYEIKPVGIKIFGEVAAVHYYYSIVIKNEEGKEKEYSGRWTDVLMKKGEKWVLIADHGGQDEDED